jgi:glycosyltransferase involved in cell wall biosynthesis
MKLEVLLPFHRCDEYFFDSALSLLNSDFQDFQILLIDDRPETIFCDRLAKLVETKNISYFRSLKRGYGSSLNLGIANANSDYLALMNSDDLVHPKRLKRQIHEFDIQKCDVVTTRIQKFHKDRLVPQLSGSFHSPSFDKAQLLFGSYSANASCMFRTEWLVGKEEFLNTDMADYLFALRSYGDANVRFLNDVLYYYRQHNTQATAQPRVVPSELYEAWSNLSEDLSLPCASKEVSTCLALPSIPTKLTESLKLELNDWVHSFFNRMIQDSAMSSSRSKEYSQVIFRRLIALNRHNKDDSLAIRQFFTLYEMCVYSSSLLSDITIRKKFSFSFSPMERGGDKHV